MLALLQKRSAALLVATVSAGAIAVPGVALSQIKPLEAQPAQEAASVSEIVVMAQRRQENLERTPVSVSVLSADALAKGQITSQADLQIATPGLVVRASTSSNELNFAVRGQSLDAYSGTRPGVLPYFNDVQIGGAGVSTTFYDLQSVQVLKGPQGTLFGRNSTGGAVLFTSAAPASTFGGYLSLSGGDYDTTKVEGAVNIPLVDDRLLARVAAVYSTNAGYQRNLYTGQALGGARRFGARFSLLAKLPGRVQNALVVDYYDASGTSTTGVLSSLLPSGGFPSVALYSNATFPTGSGPLMGRSVSDYVFGEILQAQGVPATTAATLAQGHYAAFISRLNDPNAPAGGLPAVLAAQNGRGPYKVAINSADNFSTHNLIVTNTTTIDLNADTQIKNILGYSNIRGFTNNDLDGTIFQLADDGPDRTSGIRNLSHQFSEEIQLLGDTLDGRLRYVTGVYYSDESLVLLQESYFFDILGGAFQYNAVNRENTTVAGYAQGTYDLSGLLGVQGLSATAGLRLTDEKVEDRIPPLDSTYGLAALMPGVYDNDQSHTARNLGYTVGLQEQLNPTLLLYLTSRRSYKDGGFAQLPGKIGYGDVGGNAYKTETLTDVEFGSKFKGSIFGTPVRLNGDVYYDWIRNSQRAAFTTVGGAPEAVTVNVPEARVYGFETDGEVRPADWLRLGASLTYTHARFTRTATFVDGGVQDFRTYPDTPAWSGVVYADVTEALPHDLSWTVHADAFGQTKTYFSSTANLDPGAVIQGYGLLNLRFSLDNRARDWSLTANVKNVLDKTYYVGGVALGQLVGVDTRIPGTPRTFLIEARTKF